MLAFDPAVHNQMWLMDYLPEIAALESARAPSIGEILEGIEGRSVTTVMVPHDCRDGMSMAYWRRPWAYLDPGVWAGCSALRQIAPSALQRGLSRLERDLRYGRWHQRYGHLLHLEEFDCGLRLLVGEAG